MHLFLSLALQPPNPTQKGTAEVSPHATLPPSDKGSAYGLHPCRWRAVREGDPSSAVALVCRGIQTRPTLRGGRCRGLPPPCVLRRALRPRGRNKSALSAGAVPVGPRADDSGAARRGPLSPPCISPQRCGPRCGPLRVVAALPPL